MSLIKLRKLFLDQHHELRKCILRIGKIVMNVSSQLFFRQDVGSHKNHTDK